MPEAETQAQAHHKIGDDAEYDKDFEDDEDESFDDADEEVSLQVLIQLEAIESDEHFKYDSPFDNYCPLIHLKNHLAKLEVSEPEFFKAVISSLTQEELNNLLFNIKASEDYLAKVQEERLSNINN